MSEAASTVAFWCAILGAGLITALTAIGLRWVLVAGCALTALLLAVVAWDVYWAEESDFYDVGREGALIFGIALAVFGLALFALSAWLGRLIRRRVCRGRTRASV